MDDEEKKQIDWGFVILRTCIISLGLLMDFRLLMILIIMVILIYGALFSWTNKAGNKGKSKPFLTITIEEKTTYK